MMNDATKTALKELQKRELAMLEARCRRMTGMTLGVVAFAASYSLLLIEGQTSRPGFHFYPWVLGLLMYLAGDLITLVWMRASAVEMSKLILAAERLQMAESREGTVVESHSSNSQQTEES